MPANQISCGIYLEGCGLDNIIMSWGHDEYLYHVVKDYLPKAALYMVRYHSFYPWHKEGAYQHRMNEKGRDMLAWVRAFNPYELYSKSTEPPDVEKLRPYHQALIAEYFPPLLRW